MITASVITTYVGNIYDTSAHVRFKTRNTQYTYLYILSKLISVYTYVSESDILGPNGILSDIKNLVSFEGEMYKDSR